MGTLMNSERKTWADGVRRVNAEAAGVIDLQVVLQGDIPELLAQTILGDPEAARLVPLVAQTTRRIRDAPAGRPMLCGACPMALRGLRYSIVCAVPRRPDAKEALTLAICPRCGTDYATVIRSAGQALQRIWPNSRTLDVHPNTGSA